jgi:hypothetical protein
MGAVAEGVETLDHLRTVTMAGCDVQGFYFSKPVPARQVGAVLQKVPERLRCCSGRHLPNEKPRQTPLSERVTRLLPPDPAVARRPVMGPWFSRL